MAVVEGEDSSPSAVNLSAEADFWLGRMLVQPSICRVVYDNISADLQPKIVQVLTVLTQARGRAVSREELLKRCWAGVTVGDDSVHRCIARLRKLSEDAPGSFDIITQSRVGYRLVECEPPPPPPDMTIEALKAKPENTGALPWRLGAALLAVSILGVAGVVIVHYVKIRNAPSPYLMAVRDFRVDGVESAKGVGVADAIASAVAEHQLPVVSREPGQSGDAHGARYFLNGTVRRVGVDAEVDVELDDARSGILVWSNAMRRPFAEFDALQDQAAAHVADQMGMLRAWLGSESDKATPEGVAALIRGQELMRQGRKKIVETRDAFREFVALEPNLSRAHSALAMATTLALWTQPPSVADQWRAEATAEAHKALQIDPHNGEGYMALGTLLPDSQWSAREALYQQGLKADPDDASLCNFLGELLLDAGHMEEGVQWIDRGVRSDPYSSPKTSTLIYALSVDGQFDRAQSLFERAHRLWPSDRYINRVILYATLLYGAPREGVERLKSFQSGEAPLPQDRADAWRAFEAGRLKRDVGEAAALFTKTTSEKTGADDLGASITGLSEAGAQKAALKLFGASVEKGWDLNTRDLFATPNKEIRMSPLLVSFTSKLGLNAYWKSTGRKPDFCATEAQSPECLQ